MTDPRFDTEPPPWTANANCLGLDQALFFPERGASAEAKAACAGCVVRDECLDHALTEGEKFGIWGGRTERERRPLRAALASGRRCAHCDGEFVAASTIGRSQTYCSVTCRKAAKSRRARTYPRPRRAS